MNTKIFCGLVAILIPFTFSLWAGQPNIELIPPGWDLRSTITVPRLENDCLVDGIFKDGEWEGGTQIGLVINEMTGYQSSQPATFYFGYRNDDFLVGCQTVRPKGSGLPKTNVTTPGWTEKQVWVRDDVLEVWLAPFKEGWSCDGMLTPAYCLAVNFAGAYNHRLFGINSKNIPQLMRVGTHTENENVSCELKIPFSVLDAIKTASPKSPPGDGVEWAGTVYIHEQTPSVRRIMPQTKHDDFIHFVFSDKPVGYRVSPLLLEDNENGALSIEIKNGTKETIERRVEYEVFKRNEIPKSVSEQFWDSLRWIRRIREVGYQKAGMERPGILDAKTEEQIVKELNQAYTGVICDKTTISIPANKTEHLKIKFKAPEGYYLLGYRIFDCRTGQLAMQQVVPAILTTLPMKIRQEFLKAKKIVVYCGPGAVPGVSADDILSVQLLDSTGTLVASEEKKVSLDQEEMVFLLSTEKTAENKEHTVRAILRNNIGQKNLAQNSKKIFRPQNPEWYNTNLGLTDKVPPDFEEIKKIDKGFQIGMRKYYFEGSILPTKIDTRDAPLLAGPVNIRAWANAKEVSFERQKIEILKISPTQIVQKQVWKAGRLILNFQTTLDYDGFYRVDLEINGTLGEVIERLTLNIPVVEQYAKRFGIAPALGTRMSGLGITTSFCFGELDRFYRVFPDGLMPFSYVLYLGCRDRGIEWVAESERNWSNKDETRLMGLIKEKDSVSMTFNLIDEPVQLNEKRHFSFGLIATPVRKPIAASEYYNRERSADFVYYGITNAFNPYENERARQHARWLAENGLHYILTGPAAPQNLFSNIRQYDEKQLSVWRGCSELCRKNGLVSLQYCGFALPEGIPGNESFGDEMRMEPQSRNWYNHASPFMDYWLHGAKFMMEECQVDGFHTDGLSSVPLMNNLTYDYGWEKNGIKHGTYPVFAVREFFKRFYHLLKFEIKDGHKGFHSPHVGCFPVFSIESFSDMGNVCEPFFGVETLKDISLEQFSMCYESHLQGVPRWGGWAYENNLPITKNQIYTLFALYGVMFEYRASITDAPCFPYEMFSSWLSVLEMWKTFGRSNSQFKHFWDYPDLAKISSDVAGIKIPPDAIKISAYTRPEQGAAILIVGNLDGVGYSMRIAPNLTEIGLPGKIEDYVFIDPLTKGYSYVRVGNELRLDIYPQRWRAILLKNIKPMKK